MVQNILAFDTVSCCLEKICEVYFVSGTICTSSKLLSAFLSNANLDQLLRNWTDCLMHPLSLPSHPAKVYALSLDVCKSILSNWLHLFQAQSPPPWMRWSFRGEYAAFVGCFHFKETDPERHCLRCTLSYRAASSSAQNLWTQLKTQCLWRSGWRMCTSCTSRYCSPCHVCPEYVISIESFPPFGDTFEDICIHQADIFNVQGGGFSYLSATLVSLLQLNISWSLMSLFNPSICIWDLEDLLSWSISLYKVLREARITWLLSKLSTTIVNKCCKNVVHPLMRKSSFGSRYTSCTSSVTERMTAKDIALLHCVLCSVPSCKLSLPLLRVLIRAL